MTKSIFIRLSKGSRINLVSLSLGVVLIMANCSHPDSHLSDKFCIDADKNIMRPENFGIGNGRLTTGINCNDLFRIEGIWAPPYVSSDFSLKALVNGQSVEQPRYLWRPFYIERSAVLGKALLAGTNTLLIPESRTFIFSLFLKNQEEESVALSLEFIIKGTLDKMLSDSCWGFTAPHSVSATKVKEISKNSVLLEQGDQSIAIVAGNNLTWDNAHNSFLLKTKIAPDGRLTVYLTFSLGATADAIEQCNKVAHNPEAATKKAIRIYDQKVADLYRKLPRFGSDNISLVHFYDRSLVSLLLNRWDVPEFNLKPFYSTGSIKGGCVGDYLWNVGECQEILSVFDPQAVKAHIRQFLETGVKHGFGFCPVNGGMLHPNYFYPINQEKIIGLTYNYVRNTGDIAFLKERIGGGTIIDSIVSQALYLDDISKPLALIDYNICDPQHKGGQSHLELRTPIGILNYTNVMPDLNGRRYLNYKLAARLSELAGRPRPDLLTRAEALKVELKKQLWDADKKWFAYKMPEAKPPLTALRYTVQIFYLLGSGVLDDEEESGILSHLNDKEFLSEYGMHSLAKQDPAYFQPDVDNGGPGACTSFPLNIAKTLYLIGKPGLAENILKRILWWGERMPYWGDSFYADTMRYREETPLQSTIDAVAGAQCIIFGMFGICPDFDGSIRINPRLPSFATKMSLTGVRFRNQVFDVDVDGSKYKVSCQGKTIDAIIGKTVTLSGGKLTAN